MSKHAHTITGDTLQELFASAAEFAALGGHSTAPATPTSGYMPPAGSTAPPLMAANPPVVPQPPAPVSTDPDDQPNANPPAYDSAGIPWDDRIHAGTKGMNQDGTWKRRRNTSDVTYNIVMAELAQKTAGTAPTVPPVVPLPPQVPASPGGNVDASPIPVPPTAPVPTTAPTVAPAIPPVPTAEVIPPTPAAPVPPVPVAEPTAQPTPSVAAGMPFQIFMPKIAEAMKAGKFSNVDLDGYLASWQLTNVGQLQADPLKAEQFYLWLKGANLVD